MFKTAWIVEFVFEAIILIACGVAWAIAGFPHFMEVAALAGAALVGFGFFYVGMIWKLKE